MVDMGDLFGDHWYLAFIQEEINGNITQRQHPVYSDLVIANYTPKAAYEGAWNGVTKASRGLIYNVRTGGVLARPFDKFFNYGQEGAPEIGLDQEVVAANKFDGSLGIAYLLPTGEPAIATRGSFQSEQAKHATALLSTTESDWVEAIVDDLEHEWSPLFEIIYPENRIVLDYGRQDYIQYLGARRIDTGEFFPADEEVLTFGELLARKPRPNAEGYVVWPNPYTAVKIKQEDYVALHKIVTGLNEKTVWTEVQKGPDEFKKFVASLPDELQPWADGVAMDLNMRFANIVSELDYWYGVATEVAWGRTEAGDTASRKEFALAVQDEVPTAFRGFMFSIADGRDYQGKVWKMIEPKGVGSRPSNSLNEEA